MSKTTIFFIAFHFSNHFNSLWLLKFRKLKKKINVQTNIAGADVAKPRVPNVFSHGFGVLRSWRKTGAQPWRRRGCCVEEPSWMAWLPPSFPAKMQRPGPVLPPGTHRGPISPAQMEDVMFCLSKHHPGPCLGTTVRQIIPCAPPGLAS